MNAIDFLLKEHQDVRGMLADISDVSQHFEAQKEKFKQCCDNLIRHERMEHEVWYPHFKNKLSAEVQHLVSEEKHAEKAIQKLEALHSEEAWKEHFLRFKSQVEQHAEEEENKLFPEVEKLFSEHELEKIGREMSEFKNKYSKH